MERMPTVKSNDGLSKGLPSLRNCLSDPIPEIFQAAYYLDAAATYHCMGNTSDAEELIRLADIHVIAEWSEALWGAGGPWTRPAPVASPLPYLPKSERIKERMPNASVVRQLLERDGYHCRFCRIPIIRAETRSLLHRAYPNALRWGRRNADQHAAFQAMWLQYDHIIPHARGGTNAIENIVVTCAPCNNGRSNLTLEEVGVADPRSREPFKSSWDGLERIHFGSQSRT